MTFFSKSSKKRFSHLCRQVLKVFREFYYDSIAHSPATGHLNKKAVNKTEMLWKHLRKCVVSFCSCDCTLFQERGIFYLFFLKVFGWRSKLSLASWFSPSNATFSFFLTENLSIRNMYIYGVLELVKRWHFPAYATKWFAENQWNIFSNASCRLSSTVSVFEEYV